jgi:hypothetical protein
MERRRKKLFIIAFLFTFQVGEVGQVNGAVRAEVEVTKLETP